MKNKKTEGIVNKDVILGTFEIKTTEVKVTDPCYEIVCMVNATVKDVLPGKYVAISHISNRDGWGERITELVAVHESQINLDLSKRWKWENQCGVDSGQLGIFDKAEYPKGDTTGEYDDKDSFYGKCCTLTLEKDNQGGTLPFGVVTSSGFGDGMYPLYVARKNKQVYAFRVKFIY